MASPSPAIDLRHLRYFVAVFDELHFGRAAQRLHIAQPPLSQAIRKLERELGVQLLERTSRVVRATPAGRVFAEEARKVLASFHFAVAEARRAGGADSPLRIGCVTYVPTRRLQQFLAALKERDASVRAEVTHLIGLEQVGRLRAGELDLGIFAHAEDYEGLEWEPLFPGEALSVFMPTGHPLAAKRLVTPGDLGNETLLTYPRAANPPFYDRYMALFEETGYRFGNLHETSPDPRDVLLAVAGGLGIALAPSSFKGMGEAGRDVIRRPLDPQLSLPDTIVAWRANAPQQLQMRLPEVREIARELYPTTRRLG